MDNEYPKRISPVVLIFIIVQALIATLFIVSIPRLFQNDRISWNETERKPQIVIEDLSKLDPDLYPENIAILQNELLKVASRSQSDINTGNKAVIEEGTFKSVDFKSYNLRFVSFELSMPDLNQSYQIYYSYSHPTGNSPVLSISILCPLDDSECREPEGQKSRQEIVAEYIGYFDFDNFSTFIKQGDNVSRPTININPLDKNPDEKASEALIQELKNAIESLGISPDLFNYFVMQQSDNTYIIPPR